ncbi:Hypothetical predicted protein [Marmota monax]|uniref:Uncharacterized protein n=1 Tax=Marmota monax TaxID=9995 RepID=A0A5E4A2G4_MARMO|nr:Hypothetical predicted protein [Marmota monax]
MPAVPGKALDSLVSHVSIPGDRCRAAEAIGPAWTPEDSRATVSVTERVGGQLQGPPGWNLSLSFTVGSPDPLTRNPGQPVLLGGRCPQSSHGAGLTAAALCPARPSALRAPRPREPLCPVRPSALRAAVAPAPPPLRAGRTLGRRGSGSEQASGLRCGLVLGPAFCGRT